jgi:hypothetical protein
MGVFRHTVPVDRGQSPQRQGLQQLIQGADFPFRRDRLGQSEENQRYPIASSRPFAVP